MRTRLLVLSLILGVPLTAGAASRITFERVLPAPHDLGAVQDVALVAVSGSEPQADVFVEHFLDHANRGGRISVRDARFTPGPAELHLAVKMFECATSDREGEGSVRDADGNRVKRRQTWVDAICTARIEVLSRFMKRVSTFYAKGEGRSSRVDAAGEDERADALMDAARAAAADAAERITPRRVRESVILDESAPSFAEGMAMIESARMTRARAVWEEALRKQPKSAALHFNLGAVCEALGDVQAARLHYLAACELAPGEARYGDELKLFTRRAR